MVHVVARALDAAVEHFRALVRKLEGEAPAHEAFVADAAGEFPDEEVLDGGCLAFGVARFGCIRAGDRVVS